MTYLIPAADVPSLASVLKLPKRRRLTTEQRAAAGERLRRHQFPARQEQLAAPGTHADAADGPAVA